eukprot:jgi/Galph1/5969/GphlegSOOS_G4629.1
MHPDWKYFFCTAETNRELLIDAYDSLPVNIARANLCRFLYMYSYGGVYADLDLGLYDLLVSY